MRHADVGAKRFGRARAAVLLLGAIACVVGAPSWARADFDITNDWVVSINVLPGPSSLTCTWAFQQSGGTFTANGSCGTDVLGGLQGTIDVVTGAVAGTGGAINMQGGPLVDFSFAGSVAPSGATISTTLSGAVTGSMTASLCRNGNVDPGEACDEGFTSGGCCTPSCTVKQDGTSCTTTLGCQIAPTCSAGACVGAPRIAGTSCEADGNRCTDDVCDGAGACTVGACSPCCGGPSCRPEPRWSCQRPTDDRSLIDVRTTPFGKNDRIVWTVPHLEATSLDDLPDPGTTPYGVCLYVLDSNDELSVLAYESVAPAGLGCGRSRCWTTGPKGVSYNGGPQRPNGAASLRVNAGADGKAKLSFVGKGPALGLGTYQPFGLYIPGGELLVELHAGDSCWSAYYVNFGEKPSIRTNARYRMRGGE